MSGGRGLAEFMGYIPPRRGEKMEKEKRLVLANVDVRKLTCGGLKAFKWIIETFQKETALALIDWLIDKLNCEKNS